MSWYYSHRLESESLTFRDPSEICRVLASAWNLSWLGLCWTVEKPGNCWYLAEQESGLVQPFLSHCNKANLYAVSHSEKPKDSFSSEGNGKNIFVSKITPSPIITKENSAFPVALRKFKC